MVINMKKFCCLRVDPRHKVTCNNITNNITNISKLKLEWCKKIRYLGDCITAANLYCTIRYDTIGEFNVDWKAEYSALSSTRSQKKKLKQPTPVPL